jgi:hypothetical protein
MKYGFIYEITNLVNQRKYIGFKVYSKGWEEYMGSSKLLQRDIKQLGVNNFKREIIEECETLEELQQREIFYLNLNDVLNNDMFYNQSIPHPKFRILKGSTNSNKGRTWDEIYGVEYATKKREALRNRIKGKKWSEICGDVSRAEERRSKAKSKKTEETKLKMSEGRKGMKFTEEHKQNLSKARLSYLAENKRRLLEL